MKTKVRLYIGYLLSQKFNLSVRGLEKKFPLLNRAWHKQEEKILEGLNKITGLKFLKNYIDVFLVNPNDTPSISHPTIIVVRGDVNRFTRILIHELIHVLCADNTKGVNWHFKIQKMFPKENLQTANHIAIYAILEAFYTDLLHQPKEIAKDIAKCQDKPNYKWAWEIVKKEGYKNIINKLRSYKE